MEEKYPENIDEVIKKILEEINLWKEHEEGLLKLRETKNPKEFEKIWNDLPGVKLAKIVKGLVLKEIRWENLEFYLQNLLKITSFEAKKIESKLKEVLFSVEIKKEEKNEKKVQDFYREPIE